MTFDSDHPALDSCGRSVYVADISIVVLTIEVVDEGVKQSSLLDGGPLYLSHVASSVSEPDVLLDESSTIYVISLGRESCHLRVLRPSRPLCWTRDSPPLIKSSVALACAFFLLRPLIMAIPPTPPKPRSQN